MSGRFAIGAATVVMLVVLRLNIGWHFYSEGVKHYNDPQWTSEPVLRAATGPLAPWYHAYLPDFHDLEGWLHGEGPEEESRAVEGWIKQIQTDWDADRRQFAAHYGLDKPQQTKASDVARDYRSKVGSWARANEEALATHVHRWRKLRAGEQEGAEAEIPFRGQRRAAASGSLAAEARAWRAELGQMERNYHAALSALLTGEQRETGPPPRPAAPLDVVDTVMTYGILAIGVLLILGLFARTACLAGAAFLLSVVMTQPFWVSAAQPTFNQYVEMFALLTLATTHVGRWGGLDFFVHYLIFGRREAPKGETDASES